MMNGKQRQILSLLLLLALFAALLPAAQAEEMPVFEEILTDMGELKPVKQAPYVLAKERRGSLWGVYTTDGEELIPCSYGDLTYVSINCFSAGDFAIPKNATMDEINSRALVTADGTMVSGFLYGTFKVYSTYWAAGWVLEKGSKKDYDYKSGSAYYRIERCDLFYLGDHALLGVKGTEKLPKRLSLTRDEFKSASAHGKYIFVQDRQKKIKAYDCEFNQLDLNIKKMDEQMYVIKNWAVTLRGVSGILLDGFSAVKEAHTDAGLLLSVTRLDYAGKKWNSLFTPEGEQLMPFVAEEISSVTKDYVLLTANNKQGLYSLREQKMLIPCAFDKVVASTTSLDPYLQHGYLCVERDGKRYYLHMGDSRIYEASSPGKEWTQIGGAFVRYNGKESKSHIWAPDQVESFVDDAKIANDQNRGSGYLLSFSSTLYKNMIVDWHGNRILKFYNNPFTVTDDDRIIVKNKDSSYKLLKLATE